MVIGRESADNTQEGVEDFITYKYMMIVMTDIEAIINSRPMIYVGDHIQHERIITLALLAVGLDLGNLPDTTPRKAKCFSRSSLGTRSDSFGLVGDVNICGA